MRLGQIGFSCWELIFTIFRKFPVPSIYNIEIMNTWKSYMWTAKWRIIWRKVNITIIKIFSFLLSTCNRNTYFQTINQYFVVSEWKRQVVIEQTRFLSTVFSCGEFKLENIYSGVNFCGRNVLFAGTYVCGSLEKPQKTQKLEPAKISCHTVDMCRHIG